MRHGHRIDDRLRRVAEVGHAVAAGVVQHGAVEGDDPRPARGQRDVGVHAVLRVEVDEAGLHGLYLRVFVEVEQVGEGVLDVRVLGRSEEHTYELTSLMRISYAVFCLEKKKYRNTIRECRSTIQN